MPRWKSPGSHPRVGFLDRSGTLYVLIGIAAFLVWRQGARRRNVKTALGLFAAQLILNALWPLVFFGMHSILGGLLLILLLLVMILLTTRAFFPISQIAGWLFIPYLLWVSYALVLNASILQLN